MARKTKQTARQSRKVAKVMREFKSGSLRSGSGPKVRSRKQAVAIAMRQAGLSRKRKKATGRKR